MITPTTFKNLYPEFAAESDPRVQTFLDVAWEELGSRWDAYPLRKDRAQGLLAAHALLGANRGSGSPGGPVTSDSVGDLSRSYGSSAVYTSNLGNTFYGQEFERLKKMTIPAAAVLS
jgi:Protein of unknown function (DUF4054)